jgi:hypothetical protein
VRTGTPTKDALKLTLARACLLAALVALRWVVPPSLTQTVVWTRWTVVPAEVPGKWRACTTAYALTGVVTTCGPPLNYTDALWSTVTHGGGRRGTVEAQALCLVLSSVASGLSLLAVLVALASRR